MSTQSDFVDHCADLLAPLGHVLTKRMFGGWGVYIDDVFVAIVVEEVLYLKADDATRPRFEAAGSRRFEYMSQGQPRGMGYWTVPEGAMDSPALMQPWGRLALDAALRAKKPAARKRR